MARRIVRSARADEDLIEIWLWIARDDIRPGLRHLVAGRYLILYRVDAAVVRILRVLHGRWRIAGTDVGSGPDDP